MKTLNKAKIYNAVTVTCSILCMLLIGTAHIGEVQVSLWDEATRKACEEAGVMLL